MESLRPGHAEQLKSPFASCQRFLMIQDPGVVGAGEEAARPQIDVVLNWFEELKARVPVE